MDNNLRENWFASVVQYGNGDYGTPARDWQSLDVSKNPKNSTPRFSLLGSFPNPFNSSTSIRFDVFIPGRYIIRAYTLNGSFIETLFESDLDQGSYDFRWVAENISSGVYLLSMESATGADIKKVLYLK